jgi:hypothetical protein
VSWSPHERTGQPARRDPGRARSGPAAGGSSCQSTCGDSDPPAELLRSGRSSSGSPMTAAALSVMVQISRSRPASNIRRTRAGRPSAMQGAASLSKAAPQALPHRGDRLVDQTCACVSKHAEECEFQVRGTRLRDHTARRRRRHHRLERNRCTLHRVRPSWPHHVRSSLPHSWPRGPTGPIACPRVPRRRPAPVELHCRSGYPGA